MKLSKRANHIDLLESFAIFFVVAYHCTIYSFDFLKESTWLNYASYYLRTILSTCVPLFFFANGYLLFNREFNLKKHIKKIVRLILLILFWGLLQMALYMMISGETVSIKTMVFSLLNLDVEWSMNTFWFLGALICMYILFPALKTLFDADKKSFSFFVAVCAFLTFGFVFGNQIITIITTVTHWPIPNLNYPLFNMVNPFRGSYGYSFVYFCVGGMIYNYEDKILAVPQKKRNSVAVVGIIFSSFLLFLIGAFYTKFVDGKIWDVVWNGYDTIFTFFNVIFIYILTLNYNKEYRFIREISVNTLGIYFLHGLIIRLSRPAINTVDFLCVAPVNIVYAFLIVCVCLLLCLVIRKIPLLKKLI